MNKTKRNLLSMKEKIKIIRHLQLSNDQSKIVKEMDLSKSVLIRIWRDKDNLLNSFINL
jgi:hypothetical protein